MLFRTFADCDRTWELIVNIMKLISTYTIKLFLDLLEKTEKNLFEIQGNIKMLAEN